MPHTVPVPLPGGRAYPVHLDRLEALPHHLSHRDFASGTALVVTDANVAPLYLGRVRASLERAGWTVHAHAVPAGEASKSLKTLGGVYDWALGKAVDRSALVIALGGGVVGDLAGFAAATLLRGVPYVHVPTSVIAQVDSAVGGKTGINHAAGKNLVGAFHQPALVLADVATLDTLPHRELTSGLAEVVKAALLGDADFVSWLEQAWPRILARDPATWEALVARSVGIKAEIVAEDEREAGRRAVLNLGHTFGHAIEKAAGYGRFTHGETVALGMRAAVDLSGRLHPALDAARADALIARIPVPEGLQSLSVDVLMEAMRSDKKRRAGRDRLILLERIGAAFVTDTVEPAAIRATWERLQERVA